MQTGFLGYSWGTAWTVRTQEMFSWKKQGGEASRKTERSKWGIRKKFKSPFNPATPLDSHCLCLFSYGILLVERFRGGPEFPAENPEGRQPIERESACFTFSWTPTLADFSATSSKYETPVFVPGSRNFNYIIEEEPSQRKWISADNDPSQWTSNCNKNITWMLKVNFN